MQDDDTKNMSQQNLKPKIARNSISKKEELAAALSITTRTAQQDG